MGGVMALKPFTSPLECASGTGNACNGNAAFAANTGTVTYCNYAMRG